jgi:hypothetical protein
MVCPGRTQTRKVPVLSGQYSYREEIVDNINRGVSEADVSILFYIKLFLTCVNS